MGVLMLTGIMAIFEMAISFDSQQMNFRLPRDSYVGSNAQTAERDLMGLLAKPNPFQSTGQTTGTVAKSFSGVALCDQLMLKMDPSLNYRPGLQTTSTSSELIGSCALSSSQSDHRMLIAPNTSTDPFVLARRPYRLFSCSLDQESTCPFELN